MVRDVTEKSAEINALSREIQTKPKGIAYMYRQKLEELLKNEMGKRADLCFQEFYEKIAVHADELRVEKTRKAEDEGRRMLLNLSCLLSKGQSEKLGETLEEIDNREGFFLFGTPVRGHPTVLCDTQYDPKREPHATLVDLLDRVLDKGLVIQADLMVSVAGIPLIGVNLRAALAGMETMLEYGIMQAWDEKTRAWEGESRKKKKEDLLRGEKVVLKMRGALHLRAGITRNWQYGHFYLTSRRLILYHENFGGILFQTSLDEIRGVALSEREGATERRELHLLSKENQWHRLSATPIETFKQGLETAMGDAGYPFQDLSANERETCPRCQRLDLARTLLNDGCADCGWTSPGKPLQIEALA